MIVSGDLSVSLTAHQMQTHRLQLPSSRIIEFSLMRLLS